MSSDDAGVHPTAQGFDLAASEYERSRPDYPEVARQLVADRLRIGPGRELLELGAGTGIMTRPLAASGAMVTAVEPSAAMRARLAQGLDPSLRDHVRVVAATAESLPLADASQDGAVAAQCFHWFDAVRALRELHRVLRPNAWLAVLHNRRDVTTPAQAAIQRLLAPYLGDTPSWVDTAWSDVLDRPLGFRAAELSTFPHHQRLDAQGFVDRIASVSFVTQLPDAERTPLLASADDLAAELLTDGAIDLHYVTEVRLLQRVELSTDP